MTRQTLCTIAAIVTALAVDPADAQTSHGALVQREDQITVELESFSESGLKAAYLQCSGEAMQRALGSGEAALCSTIYETLLRRSFGGDFHALLAWSRSQRDETDAVGFQEAVSNAEATLP